MNLHSRLRAGSAAVLTGAVLLTAACSNATPGAPVAAAASSTSASSTSSSPATTEVTTVTVTASSSTTESSTSTSTTTTESDDTVTTDPATTDSVPTDDVEVDAVTAAWAGTTCTQMTYVLTSVLAAPGLDGSEPVDYQQEWTAYYATLADTAITATGELAALDPPTFTDGDVFHEGIVSYLTELGLTAGNGSIAVGEAGDQVAAQTAVQETQAGISALSEGDYGLAGFQSGEVTAVLRQVPECESFAG